MSIGVLPTRSPMPRMVPCTRVGARFERRQAVDRAHVAIAMAVPVDADCRRRMSSTICFANVTTARAPAGVAWPTVSAMQMR